MYLSPEEIIKKIEELKKKRNAVILAHYYQEAEIQDIADFVGDSLDLSRKAADTDADVIVFCGVKFMAETAKLLSPEKTVLIPDKDAGCPLANMINPHELRELKAQHPGALVVTYVNSSVSVKAESDYCCTSSNAAKVVASLPKDAEIIFAPDKNLGRWVSEKTGRKMTLWNGFCPTHQRITLADIESRRSEYPDAKVAVHPECVKDVCDAADYVGSTSGILRYVRESDARQFIIGTEKGILHPLRAQNPGKEMIPASELAECPNMKFIDLEKVLASLEESKDEITVPDEIAEKANLALKRMIEIV